MTLSPPSLLDAPPERDQLTEYDREHFATYLLLLDWSAGRRLVRRNPSPARLRRCMCSGGCVHLLLSDIPAIAYAFSLPNGDDFRRMSRTQNTVDRHYAYLPFFRAPSASPADGAFL
jgi:hypothetical protein